MENIVFGISAINFQPNCIDITNENRAPNRCISNTTTTTNANEYSFPAESSAGAVNFNSLPPVSCWHFQALAMSANAKPTDQSADSANVQLDEADSELNSSTETVAADEAAACSSTSDAGTHFSNCRRLPARASKEQGRALYKTKRRSIMKPTKRLPRAAVNDFTSLRPADIRKIYMNKKLSSFHPSKLETIFEEPQHEDTAAESQVRFVGARKLKRSISLRDGLNTTKTVIKQRRLKIKKKFGRPFALKKISLEDFLQRLSRSFEVDEDTHVDNKTETPQLPATSEAMDSEMDGVDILLAEDKLKTVPPELLLPTPDCGVLIKSNSFSGVCSPPADGYTNILLS